MYFIRIESRQEFIGDSELSWIDKNKIIITIDNDYYLMNLDNPELVSVGEKLLYGSQQVFSGLFITLVAQ